VLIDVAVLGDSSVVKKEAEHILRTLHSNRAHVECKNKSDTINTNRGNWNHLRIIQNIFGKHNTKELMKTAILGTVQILHKALRYKYKMFITGNNITCNIKCNYSIAATLYTLQTWFVSGI
jgi:hypothetical protein